MTLETSSNVVAAILTANTLLMAATGVTLYRAVRRHRQDLKDARRWAYDTALALVSNQVQFAHRHETSAALRRARLAPLAALEKDLHELREAER